MNIGLFENSGHVLSIRGGPAGWFHIYRVENDGWNCGLEYAATQKCVDSEYFQKCLFENLFYSKTLIKLHT